MEIKEYIIFTVYRKCDITRKAIKKYR